MALQGTNSIMQPPIPAVRGSRFPLVKCQSMIPMTEGRRDIHLITSSTSLSNIKSKSKSKSRGLVAVFALDHRNSSHGDGPPPVPNSNYVVPLDLPSSFSCITRPLAEILRDLNKRIPDNIVKPRSNVITWYHANRMLSFYAPGWCGEIRDVIYSDSGSVTVVYRVTVRGSDGEAHRESTGTVLSGSVQGKDPVAAAEELAFCRACARFGLGLYLYHED